MSKTLSLADKTLIMLVGPTSIGKSTLMNSVVAKDHRFSRVRSFTTRPPRGNDESGHYFYLSESERIEKANTGDIITDVVYPTTGHHYGTLAQSYAGEYNLLDTLANSVEDYRRLPFGRTVTISLTADPEEWERWLASRYPEHGTERIKRLQEAVLSMEWSLAQASDHQWLVNKTQDIGLLSSEIIHLVTDHETAAVQSPIPPEAIKLLERAKTLLSYE